VSCAARAWGALEGAGNVVTLRDHWTGCALRSFVPRGAGPDAGAAGGPGADALGGPSAGSLCSRAADA